RQVRHAGRASCHSTDEPLASLEKSGKPRRIRRFTSPQWSRTQSGPRRFSCWIAGVATGSPPGSGSRSRPSLSMFAPILYERSPRRSARSPASSVRSAPYFSPTDRRQLFLQVNDNYSCRSSPGGWTPAATMLTPGGGDDGERGSHLHGSGLVGGRRALLGLFGADALTVELEDDRVVDDAVDGGGGGHGILEDAV